MREEIGFTMNLVFRDVDVEEIRKQHTPALQDHGYDRCALCNYTHAPCDVYDLCMDWLAMHQALINE